MEESRSDPVGEVELVLLGPGLPGVEGVAEGPAGEGTGPVSAPDPCALLDELVPDPVALAAGGPGADAAAADGIGDEVDIVALGYLDELACNGGDFGAVAPGGRALSDDPGPGATQAAPASPAG